MRKRLCVCLPQDCLTLQEKPGVVSLFEKVPRLLLQYPFTYLTTP